MKTFIILLQLSVLVLVGCQGKKSSKQSPPKEEAKKETPSVPPPSSPLDISPSAESSSAPKANPKSNPLSDSAKQQTPTDRASVAESERKQTEPSSSGKTAVSQSNAESITAVDTHKAADKSMPGNGTGQKDSNEAAKDAEPELAPEMQDAKEVVDSMKECLRGHAKQLYATIEQTVGFKTQQQVYALMDSSILLCEKELKEQSSISNEEFSSLLENAMVEVISEYKDLKEFANQWLNYKKSQKAGVANVESLYTALQYKSSNLQIRGKFLKKNVDLLEYSVEGISGSEELSVKTIQSQRTEKSFLYNINPDKKTKISISLKVNNSGYYDFIIETNSKKNVYQVGFTNGNNQDLKKSFINLVFSEESWQRLIADSAAKVFSEDLKREVPASRISIQYSDRIQKLVRACNFNENNIVCTDPDIDFSAKLKD